MTASARGLFRATGKKSKPVSVASGNDLAGAVERVEYLPREADDFYPTPPEPTWALLSAERYRLADFPAIWEPAAGDGAMAHEIRKDGHRVICSDLIDRGCGAEIKSFYDFETAPSTAIVTNPPFQECGRSGPWVRHALEVLAVEYMALLLPVAWPSAMERAWIWTHSPPARVYFMRWRIDWTGQGASPVSNAWFVWDRQASGETVLRMLDRRNPSQSEMFEATA